MPALALPGWMDQPWTEAWLSFNLEPARWVHPLRRAGHLPPALADWLDGEADDGSGRFIARHCSGAMLREAAMAPADRLDDPVLPLALLDDKSFAKLALWCGLVVIGPTVRQAITRTDVQRLEACLGFEALQFARRQAGALWGEAPGADLSGASDPGEVAARLGIAILSLAVAEATPAVLARASLRLPPDGARARDQLPPGLTDGLAALALAREVLHVIDPQWLSSFPTAR